MRNIIVISIHLIFFFKCIPIYSQYKSDHVAIIENIANQRKERLAKNIDSSLLLNKILPYTNNKNYNLEDIKGIRIIPYLSLDLNCAIKHNCEGSNSEILSCLVDSLGKNDFDYYVINLGNKEYFMFNETINSDNIIKDFNASTFIKIKDTYNNKRNLVSINGTIVVFHKNSLYYEGGLKNKYKFALHKRHIQMTLFYSYGIKPCGNF